MLELKKIFDWIFGIRPSISNKNYDSTLESIPTGFDFMQEGSGFTTVTGPVGEDVRITISGDGSVIILGDIGRRCRILIEGKGELSIEGQVEPDLKLTVYGRGKVFFVQRPYQEVINSIKKRGQAAKILYAGVTLDIPTQEGYIRHQLGGLFDSNQYDSEQSESEQSDSEQVVSRSSTPSAQPQDELNPLTREYIELCQQRKHKTIAERISELNLTENEIPLFKNLIDCIMQDYFTDIPVIYDEKYYNYSWLLHLHNNGGADPYSRKPILLSAISSARIKYNDLDDAIIELGKRRAAQKQTVAPPNQDQPSSSFSM